MSLTRKVPRLSTVALTIMQKRAQHCQAMREARRSALAGRIIDRLVEDGWISGDLETCSKVGDVIYEVLAREDE